MPLRVGRGGEESGEIGFLDARWIVQLCKQQSVSKQKSSKI